MKDEPMITKVGSKKLDEKSMSKKSSDHSNKDQKHKKKNHQKMLILEKIIHSENDTCTEDDDVSDSGKLTIKTMKTKKDKKKLNEFDWIKVR